MIVRLSQRGSRPRTWSEESWNSPRGEEFLCKRCRKIDVSRSIDKMKKASEKGIHIPLGILAAKLGAINTWDMRDCKLCRFLLAILRVRGHLLSDSSSETYELRAYCSSSHYTWPRGGSNFHCTKRQKYLLAIKASSDNSVPLHLIIAVSPRIDLLDPCSVSGFLRPLGAQIDFGLLRGWIERCENSHRQCTRLQPPKTERRSISMKLIDCSALKVIKTESICRYAALSYVWGSPEKGELVHANLEISLPERLPRVVEDAMRVARELQIQYLWVDRYCIDQQNAIEKHDQISNMHLVYSNAIVTFIAAAGEGPDYGLPGVQNRKRNQQPYARIRGNDFAMLTIPEYLVSNSAWATRGWAYQEAIFSRRKLFFTDHQAYFECADMICWEALSREDVLSEDTEAYSYALYNSIDVESRRQSDLEKLRSYITTYSSRNLTYTSDRLNALLGMFQAFQESQNPVYHIWGQPIMVGAVSAFLRSLFWESREGDSSRRIMGLPSWSWTGWTGKMCFEWCLGPESVVCVDSIAVELEDGSQVSLEESDTLARVLRSKSHLRPSQILVICSWTLHARFQYFAHNRHTGMIQLEYGLHEILKRRGPLFCCVLDIPIAAGGISRQYYEICLNQTVENGSTLHRRLQEEHWDCILLTEYRRVGDSRPSIKDCAALILDCSGDKAERIGHIFFFRGPLWKSKVLPKIQKSPIDTHINMSKRTIRLG